MHRNQLQTHYLRSENYDITRLRNPITQNPHAQEIAMLRIQSLKQQEEIARLKAVNQGLVKNVATMQHQFNQTLLANNWLVRDNTRLTINNAQLTEALMGTASTCNTYDTSWEIQQNSNQNTTTPSSLSSPSNTPSELSYPPANYWQEPLATTTSNSYNSYAKLLESWQVEHNANNTRI